MAARLSAVWPRLVCVQGDSNAWARRDPARQPPEIVHWVAHRPATGATFEALVAPRRPLAPGTPAQTELSAARISAGGDVAEWRMRWRGFSRADDLVVTWGSFYAALADEDGLELSAERLDLRREVLALLRAETFGRSPLGLARAPELRAAGNGRLRTVDACAEILGVTVPALPLGGRAGRRLAALSGVLAVLAAGLPADDARTSNLTGAATTVTA